MAFTPASGPTSTLPPQNPSQAEQSKTLSHFWFRSVKYSQTYVSLATPPPLASPNTPQSSPCAAAMSPRGRRSLLELIRTRGGITDVEPNLQDLVIFRTRASQQT